MKRLFAIFSIAVLHLSLSLALPASPPGPEPMTVVQPAYVSAVDPTPVTCMVYAPSASGGRLAVYLMHPGDGGEILLSNQRVSLSAGGNEVTVRLRPESFDVVPLYDDFTLRFLLTQDDGSVVSKEVESTLLPREAASLGSQWSVAFQVKPSLLYTTRNSGLDISVFSPKSAARTAKIKIKFMDERGKKKVKMPPKEVLLQPGSNTVHLSVPSDVAALASQRGDVRGRIVLKVRGVVKATDEAPLDFDLQASATADRNTGRAPLDVAFQGAASGGAPPYAYAWSFGDGTSSVSKSPDHTYVDQGDYSATLTVTDAMGGTVVVSVDVNAGYPELLVSCQAVPTVGVAPLTVLFSTSSEGGDGHYTYTWNFGDGEQATVASPSHVYQNAGAFEARLTVTSGDQTVFCSRTITAVVPTYALRASAGPGGVISPSGTISVTQGDDLAFTITPNPGYQIADVSVDGASIGPVPAYTFMDVRSDHTISAVFVRITHVVSASAGPGGAISPAGPVTVYQGDDLVLAITPDPGFGVKDVTVDGISVGRVLSYHFTDIQTDHTIAAAFERAEFTIAASAGTGGSVDPSGAVSLARGAGITFAMTPDAGNFLDDVLVDDASIGPFATYSFEDVQADHTLRAVFSVRPPGAFIVSALAGPGGHVAPAGALVVQAGTDQPVVITPNVGYHVVDVKVDDVPVGPVGVYTFTTVQTDHTILATFARDVPGAFLITATAGPGGTIDPSGATTVLPGGDQAFTITPAPLYQVQDVQIDGISIGPTTISTFTGVDKDHTIHATFSRAAYLIKATSTTGGSIDPVGNVTVPPGGDKVFTLAPDPEYRIADLLVDGVSQGAIDTYTFSGVAADHTIEAVFEPDTLTVTTSVTGNGSIAPSGTVHVFRGNDLAFIMMPDPGYRTGDVVVDGTSVGPVSPYTFHDVQTDHTIAVTFVPDVPSIFTISATSGSGGSISPSGDVSVVQGNYQVFSITPETGYAVSDVLVDGQSVGATSSYIFYSVQEDHTIHADFAPAGGPPSQRASGTSSNLSTSTSPLSVSFNDGMTGSARKASVMKGAGRLHPQALAAS